VARFLRENIRLASIPAIVRPIVCQSGRFEMSPSTCPNRIAIWRREASVCPSRHKELQIIAVLERVKVRRRGAVTITEKLADIEC